MIVFAALTDGRDDLLDQTLTSAGEMLAGQITRRILWDDTGDPFHLLELVGRYPDIEVISNGRRNGFGGAVHHLWAHLRDHTVEPYVWWQEDDFTYNQPIYLPDLAATLSRCPHLAQLALVRQPWNDAEKAAGTILWPAEDFKMIRGWCAEWIEHRRWWTTNCAMFRREVLNTPWPDCPHSEGVFTHRLLDHGFGDITPDKVRFGYWGQPGDPPRITHRGNHRAGVGY